ncbi:MAG TPA: tRNA (adenosine(37)-N6)-threonylcarbamoyltransferase complex ATPase subunit type 1 TsaE [Polyangiales bacterium]
MAGLSYSGGSEGIQIVLRTRADTRRLGGLLACCLRPGDLVVLEGDLGAGKTFLVRAIARALGVPASVPVTSPTFELVHELPGRVPIVHADLYRLADSDSLEELGLGSRIGADAVVLVEWGDRFAAHLGQEGLWLALALADERGRTCTLTPKGPAGHALLARLSALLSQRSREPGTRC